MAAAQARTTETSGGGGSLRPTRRVLILTTVALAFLAGLAVVMGNATGSARDDLDGVTDRALPVSLHLEATRDRLEQARSKFLQALRGPAEDRDAGVAAAQQLNLEAEGEWSAYRRFGGFGPRERELQAEFADAGKRVTASGVAAYALAGSSDREAFDAALLAEQQADDDRQAALAAIRERYARDLREGLRGTQDALGAIDAVGLSIIVVTAIAIVLSATVAYRRYSRAERVKAIADADRREHDRLSELEVQLRRGLEMEPNEEGTYEVIEAALHVVRDDRPTELLLADSSGTHFRRVVRTGGDEPGASCQVPSPHECPVTTRGDTKVFPASDRVDVCPFLRNREGPVVSAVCVPIGIAGTATGVIHAVGPAGTPPPDQVVTELELVAREAGERIGFLRVLARTEAQAETDPLTGLWNRRTLEHRVAELLGHDVSFVVAYADLDHFKLVNDTHGHDVGDRALRLFARVLRDSVRPNDLPARYGGEEFVVVLPACSLGDAGIVAERVRTELADSVVAARVPPFTMSVGLARHEPGEDFDATVIRADNAMRLAKSRGRDRVVSTEDVARGDDDADGADGASR